MGSQILTYIHQHKATSFFQVGFGLQSSDIAIVPISSKTAARLLLAGSQRCAATVQSNTAHTPRNLLWWNSPKRPNLLELLLPQAVLSWWCVIGDHCFNFKWSLNLTENCNVTLCKSLRGKYFSSALYCICGLHINIFVVCALRLTIHQKSLFSSNANTSLSTL